MEFTDLKIKGMTFDKVYKSKFWDNDAIIFVTTEGEEYILTHQQDCCEHVYIESIDGDLLDLTREPLLMAEEAYEDGVESEDESSTWSFYKFATIKGYVTIRFFGMSNGYYSEAARLFKLENGNLRWTYPNSWH